MLLTSAGFENARVREVFLELAGKAPEQMRVMFVPTAAIDPGAIAMLPKCMNDLLGAGVPEANIRVDDLHERADGRALCAFDAIYVCGGDTGHLLSRMREAGFGAALERFLEAGGVYVGVSAGSVVMKELGWLECGLAVHQQEGSAPGRIDPERTALVSLTDRQALLIQGQAYRVVE